MIPVKIKAYIRYSKEIIIWLLEARLTFLCLLVLILTFITSFYSWPSAQTIKVSGYVLQLLGMVFAIRGLLKIREHFGKPTLRCVLSAWLRKFPKWQKSGYFEPVSINFGVAVKSGTLGVWANDKPDEEIEKRLNTIWQNLNSLRDNQRNQLDQISNIIKEHKEFKEEQIEKIKVVKSEINTELEEAHTNDILVSLVGLIWLTFGITLSTLPEEIFNLIKSLTN